MWEVLDDVYVEVMNLSLNSFCKKSTSNVSIEMFAMCSPRMVIMTVVKNSKSTKKKMILFP